MFEPEGFRSPMAAVNAATIAVADAALLFLALPPEASLQQLRFQLARRLQQQATLEWVGAADPHDTLLAAIALHKTPSGLSGARLARVIKRMLQLEVRAGGPYTATSQPTFCLNILAAVFARVVAQPLPATEAFLTEKLHVQATPAAPLTAAQIAFLLHYSGGKTLFNQYMAVCQKEKLLPVKTFQRAWGELSPCESACRAYLSARLEPHQTHRPRLAPSLSDRHHKQVVRTAKKLFSQQAEPVRSQAHAIINALSETSYHTEITLLPYFFAEASPHKMVSANQCQLLGAANLCGWVAYTLYDNLLDGDAAAHCLPVANMAMRRAVACFGRAVPDPLFQNYAGQAFDAMDQANAWELANCRFAVRGKIITISRLPRFGKAGVLANRAFAHALAPLAIIWQRTSNAKVRQQAERAFRHYLIARQLADDLRDWQKDFSAGHASFVVTAVLRALRTKPATYALPDLQKAMRTTFKTRTLPYVCQQILRHVGQSKRDFAALPVAAPKEMYAILDNLSKVATQSVSAQAHNAAFANEFRR